MSVSVRDLLKLPSLRQAKVIAGKQSLHKRVTSISVLESANPSYLIDTVFEQGEYFGSEIAITGFLDCAEDIDLQCASIRRLSEGGEIGLILFYVGVYLPRVDRKLVDLADRLGFILIQMPKSKDLRYADVISDVTECLHRDRAQSDYIVSDILARMSGLPFRQRTIQSALRMISDTVMASILLTDESGHLLNQACWPPGIEGKVRDHLPEIIASANSEASPGGYFSDTRVHAFDVMPDTGIPMRLFVVKQNGPVGKTLLDQILDVTRICANIWGQGYNNIAIRELIRAILQDDPLKMRRLAEIFKIRIENIHEMWILSGDSENSLEVLQKNAETLQGSLLSCCNTVFSDIYENSFFLFSGTASSLAESDRAASSMAALVEPLDPSVTLSVFRNLKNTTEVREAWLTHENHLSDARKIFPRSRFFRSGQLDFAKECRQIIEKGEKSIQKYTDELLFGNSPDTERIDDETLSVYMLDADSNVAKAAALLHVHPNTVKYRLKTIDNSLGLRHDKMPDSMKLFYAEAIRRLLK